MLTDKKESVSGCIDYSDTDDNGVFKGLEGHCLIYFGPGDWSGMWRNRHQLMSRFAHTNKVMYVEPLYSMYKFRQLLRRRRQGIIDLWQAFRKPRVSQKADNIFIYHSPIFVPIFGRYP